MCRLVSKLFIWSAETYAITRVGPECIYEGGILSNSGNLRIHSDAGMILVLARVLPLKPHPEENFGFQGKP